MPDPTQGRRHFFREGFSRIVGPVADYLAKRLHEHPDTPLRPPGAIPETRFGDICFRCGACADVCPAHAIQLLPPSAGPLAGTPVVLPDSAACVVCDGLLCTHRCPSGALQPLTEPADIAMGTAKVYARRCVRSAGEDCTICVDRCPMGPAALTFEGGGPPVVHESGCVGCGVCQFHCPTDPKAIVVVPKGG